MRLSRILVVTRIALVAWFLETALLTLNCGVSIHFSHLFLFLQKKIQISILSIQNAVKEEAVIVTGESLMVLMLNKENSPGRFEC